MASAFGHFNCYYINRYVKWQSKCRNTYIDVSIVFLRNAYAHHSLFMTFINENRHFMKKLNFWFVIMSARSNKTFCQEFISSIITSMKWRNKKSFINVIKFNFIYVTLHSWIVCIIVEMNRKKKRVQIFVWAAAWHRKYYAARDLLSPTTKRLFAF